MPKRQLGGVFFLVSQISTSHTPGYSQYKYHFHHKLDILSATKRNNTLRCSRIYNPRGYNFKDSKLNYNLNNQAIARWKIHKLPNRMQVSTKQNHLRFNNAVLELMMYPEFFSISANSSCYLQDIQSRQLKSYSRTEHTKNNKNLRKERQDSLIEERQK